MQHNSILAEYPQPGAVTAPHVIADHPDVLRQILEPGVNLSLWRRPTQPAVARELLPLQAAHLPDLRCQVTRETFDADVSGLLQRQGLDPSRFENWRQDLGRVADDFFEVSEDRDVNLRLETTADDACRRYHVDRTHLRLLCTYRGPGTEWLSDDQVDRDAQNSGAPNDDILRFGEPARFEAFWVGILKGHAYPGNAGRGLVHRSPPIEGSGQTRVLFCLDC